MRSDVLKLTSKDISGNRRAEYSAGVACALTAQGFDHHRHSESRPQPCHSAACESAWSPAEAAVVIECDSTTVTAADVNTAGHVVNLQVSEDRLFRARYRPDRAYLKKTCASIGGLLAAVLRAQLSSAVLQCRNQAYSVHAAAITDLASVGRGSTFVDQHSHSDMA